MEKEEIITKLYEAYKEQVKKRVNYLPGEVIDPTGEIIFVIENAVAMTLKLTKKPNKKEIKAYDRCLEKIDSLLRNSGRSNMLSKTEINHLRNDIVELQEVEE